MACVYWSLGCYRQRFHVLPHNRNQTEPRDSSTRTEPGRPIFKQPFCYLQPPSLPSCAQYSANANGSPYAAGRRQQPTAVTRGGRSQLFCRVLSGMLGCTRLKHEILAASLRKIRNEKRTTEKKEKQNKCTKKSFRIQKKTKRTRERHQNAHTHTHRQVTRHCQKRRTKKKTLMKAGATVKPGGGQGPAAEDANRHRRRRRRRTCTGDEE